MMGFALAGRPDADVTLTFAGDAECGMSPRTMTLTAEFYATAQRLGVAAIDGGDV
jgi:hypothetical protein